VSGEPVRSDTHAYPEPRLRLVDGLDASSAQTTPLVDDASPWGCAPGDHLPRVLVAAADSSTRTRMLEELCDLLPPGTCFVQASETWEVIAAASNSSMVVLAGDLGDISGGSVMRLLGRRHPTLPVLVVSEKTPTHTAADVDVAHA